MKPEIEPTFWGEFVKGIKESPRLYFAPLLAVFRAMRSVSRDIAHRKLSKRIAAEFAKRDAIR